MIETVITIHHFEDEPETTHWLPGCLLNHYWSKHPDWIVNNADYGANDDETLTSFRLRNTRRGAVKICYQTYSTPTEFESLCQANANDLVILDIVHASTDGRIEAHGNRLYPRAREAVGVERVFLLTAYPLKVSKDVQEDLPPANLFIKPPDVSQLCSAIMTALGLD